MMNKKGTEKYLSIWNFIAWIIILIVIVAGIRLFNSEEADVRGEESMTLANRVLDCLSPGGKLLNDSLSEKFDIFNACSLDKESFGSNGNFFINATIVEIQSGKTKTILAGNNDFVVQCKIKKKEKQFASCYYDSINEIISADLAKYKIEVFAGSNNMRGKM
jgi:hypothetical protein